MSDEPTPTDGSPDDHGLAVDFSDVIAKLIELGAVPHDAITPAEAAEAMDEAEAEAEAAHETIERKAESLAGANRTWAELDLCIEQERRCDLDYIATASKIFLDHTRRTEGEETTGAEWKLNGADALPTVVKREFLRFLAEVAKTGAKKAAKLGGDDHV